MKRPFILFLLVCTTLFACKKDIPQNKVDPDLLAQVVGKYEWISTLATIHDYGSPAYAQYKAATDSTDRFGITILASGEVIFYKNETITHSGYVSETVNTYVYCQLATDEFMLSVKGNELTNAYFPYTWQNGLSTNRFIRLSVDASLSLEHGQPDCSANYAICGSYTGVDTSWSSQYPFSVYPQGAKTYHLVPGSAMACDVYVLDDSGSKVFTVLNTPGYSVSVKDSMLYIEKYWYAIDKKMRSYRFVGTKD